MIRVIEGFCGGIISGSRFYYSHQASPLLWLKQNTATAVICIMLCSRIHSASKFLWSFITHPPRPCTDERISLFEPHIIKEELLPFQQIICTILLCDEMRRRRVELIKRAATGKWIKCECLDHPDRASRRMIIREGNEGESEQEVGNGDIQTIYNKGLTSPSQSSTG